MLIAALILTGCGRPDAPPKPEPAYNKVMCKGEIREETRYKISVKCEDGKIVEYSTYKYTFNRNLKEAK